MMAFPDQHKKLNNLLSTDMSRGLNISLGLKSSRDIFTVQLPGFKSGVDRFT